MSYRPICDVWILARSKTKGPDGKSYYGAYPSGFLSRARELLGVTIQDPMLHVCGGASRAYPFRGFGANDYTVDLDPRLEPDFLQDVRHGLPSCPVTDDRLWPASLADPPYTEADADHYAPGAGVFPSPNKLLRAQLETVRPGGRVGMIHYLWPRPPSVKEGKKRVTGFRDHLERVCPVRLVACIGVVVGYGNRMRVYSVFEREPAMVLPRPRSLTMEEPRPGVFLAS